jgi:hypothetical protein
MSIGCEFIGVRHSHDIIEASEVSGVNEFAVNSGLVAAVERH